MNTSHNFSRSGVQYGLNSIHGLVWTVLYPKCPVVLSSHLSSQPSSKHTLTSKHTQTCDYKTKVPTFLTAVSLGASFSS